MAEAIKIIGVQPTDTGFRIYTESAGAEAREGQFRVNLRGLEWWRELTAPTGRYRDAFMTAVAVASQRIGRPTEGEEVDLRTPMTPKAFGYKTTFGDFTVTFRHNDVWEDEIPDAVIVEGIDGRGRDVRFEIIGENFADIVVAGLMAYFDRQTDLPHDQAVAASVR